MSSTSCAEARPASANVRKNAKKQRVRSRMGPSGRKKAGPGLRPRCEGYYWRAGLARPAFLVCLELELEARAEANLLRHLIADAGHKAAHGPEVGVERTERRILVIVVVGDRPLQVAEVEEVGQQDDAAADRAERV